MNLSFPEFYRLPDAEFEKVWKECVFVFDASTLLDLYRYSQKASKEFLEILSDPKIKQRVWVPHQFAFEYQKNRLEVIAEQKLFYRKVSEKLEALVKDFSRHPFLDMKDVLKPVQKDITRASKLHPHWDKEDTIRDELTKLLSEEKIGKPFTPEEYAALYKEGQARYSGSIPPGYLDRNKGGEEQFGDLVGWKQILIHAKLNKKPIVFITGEKDSDWWQILHGERVGARYELVKEMREFANVFFCMYRPEGFINAASKYLNIKIQKDTVADIREIDKNENDVHPGQSSSTSSLDIRVAESINVADGASVLSEKDGKSDLSQSVDKIS